MLALTVRTYYMPNEDWQVICRRGRALREAEGTLTGHAAGRDTSSALDPTAAMKAIGTGHVGATSPPNGLPEPPALVVEYLGDELTQDSRKSFRQLNWRQHWRLSRGRLSPDAVPDAD